MVDLTTRLSELRQAETEAFATWHFIRGRAEECAAIMQLQEQDKAPAPAGAESPEEAP
jgi:hypothetical protein